MPGLPSAIVCACASEALALGSVDTVREFRIGLVGTVPSIPIESQSATTGLDEDSRALLFDTANNHLPEARPDPFRVARVVLTFAQQYGAQI